ncbi:MAG: EAL domain-containing protein [Lachnospiraceae bacterium]
MKKKDDNTLFLSLFAMIGIVTLSYITSLFSLQYMQDTWDGLLISCVISLSVLFFLAVSICVRTVHRLRKYDRMTGVPNSNWIMGKGYMLKHQNKFHEYVGLFLNMKDSKYNNERFGNAVVNCIITDYARALDRFLVKKGYIGRMGGDNFVVFIRSEYLDEFLRFVRKITMEIPIDGVTERITISTRCGVCRITEDLSPGEVVNHAAAALSFAKSEKRDVLYYQDDLLARLIQDQDIINQCSQAFKKREFVPYYQPKVDAKTERLCGAEALVRWKKGDEIISPAKFVPAMERAGKIVTLDMYIFDYMCKDIRDWLDRGIEPVKISSNFSKVHLKNPKFADEIFEIMDKYQISSKYVEIELTESCGFEDYENLKFFLKKFKERGICIAIDDFGTGYSSLSMLRSYEADVIKLDKSFLDDATNDNPASKQFLRDIINLISNQREQTLCEGVETKEQLTFLRDAGCKVIQGFYYDEPLSHDEFEARLITPDYSSREE